MEVEEYIAYVLHENLDFLRFGKYKSASEQVMRLFILVLNHLLFLVKNNTGEYIWLQIIQEIRLWKSH